MKNKLYLVLVLCCLTCAAGWTARAELQNSTSQKPKWEYMEIELDGRSQTTAKLNPPGLASWELVGVTSTCPSSNDSTIPCKTVAYMKRAF